METPIERDAIRYRKLKSLTPVQYRALYKEWLSGTVETFDSCLDRFNVNKPVEDDTDYHEMVWGCPKEIKAKHESESNTDVT